MEKEHSGSHIVIASPDLAVCEELSLRCRLEGYRTEFFTTGAGLLQWWPRGNPRLLILDYAMGLSIEQVPKPRPQVLMIGNPEVGAAVTSMKQGAIDVLTQPIDADRLLLTVYEALRKPAPPRVVITADLTTLTVREREVLQLIADGQSNKEAGRELGISPRTIEVHRSRVMGKLGAKNTADLMRIILLT